MKHLNERGSLPLVMVIVFIFTMTIAMLTNLLVSEKINVGFSTTTDIEKFYEADSIRQVTKNVVTQSIVSKEWSSLTNSKILTIEEFDEFEEHLNTNILRRMNSYSAVSLNVTRLPEDLESFCSEVRDVGGNFLMFTCNGSSASVQLELRVSNGGVEEIYEVLVEGLVPVVSGTGNRISINIENAKYHFVRGK